MPMMPPKPCAWPGCGVLTNERYCAEHRKQKRREDDARRGSAAARGYGPEWRRASKAFLAENPLCVRCLSKDVITASQVTDHKIPHRGDMRLFWDRKNWQALCKDCHDEKTAKEDGGFGRAATVAREGG